MKELFAYLSNRPEINIKRPADAWTAIMGAPMHTRTADNIERTLRQAYVDALQSQTGDEVIIPDRVEKMFTAHHWQTHINVIPKDLRDLFISVYTTVVRTGLCHGTRGQGCVCGVTKPYDFCEGRTGPRGDELAEITWMHRGVKRPA